MSPLRTLLIRADANAQIGWGHAMRQMAVAQAWSAAGGTAIWASTGVPHGIARLGDASGVIWHALSDVIPGSRQDAAALVELAHRENAAWIVLDGYTFGDDYEAELAAAPCPWLAVDDCHHAAHAGAEIILRPGNENIEDLQPAATSSQIIGGLKYALIRDSLTGQRQAASIESRHPQQIAIVAGGSDPKNLIGLAQKAIAKLPKSERPQLDIVCGADNRRLESLRGALRDWPTDVVLHTDCTDLAPLLRSATLLITAGGSTVLESLCLGCPTIAISVAENQLPICRQLAIDGAIEYAGSIDDVQPESLARRVSKLLRDRDRRHRYSEVARRLVDGKGRLRLVRRLALGRIRLRPAKVEDRNELFQLRNEPMVVSASKTPRTVSWDEHCEWFERTLNDSGRKIWIVEGCEARFLGQVRLEPSGSPGEAVISIALAPAARGCNLGSFVIERAIGNLTCRDAIHRIRAVIRDDNLASRAAFQRAGFCWQESLDRGWGVFLLQRTTRLPTLQSSLKPLAAITNRS